MRIGATLSTIVLLGCASRASCPPGDLSRPVQTPAFGVVRSDFTSSAIALLAADGTILDPDFVDSGTRVAMLVTSLAGDVVLPSTSLGPGRVAWLDRYGVDVLTIAEPDRAPTQIAVRGDVDGASSGASVNPWDAIALPDGRVLVARYNPNTAPGAPPLSRGDDLLVIEGTAATGRVELGGDVALDAAACTGSYCTVYARPAVLLPLAAGSARSVLAVLDRMSADYHHVSSGAVVTVAPDTLAVSAPLVIDGLVNCAYAAPDPADAARAYVLCIGPRYTAGGASRASEDDRRATAGIVEVTLDATGTLRVTGRFQPSATDPVPSNGIIAIGGGSVLYVASGSLDAPTVPDRLVSVEVASGATQVVYRASTAFVIHDGCVSGTGALVPDAAANAILYVEGGAVMRSTTFDDCIGLPPVQIRPL